MDVLVFPPASLDKRGGRLKTSLVIPGAQKGAIILYQL